MASNLCTKCGAAWNGETGKYPCAGGGQCDIPAARRNSGAVRAVSVMTDAQRVDQLRAHGHDAHLLADRRIVLKLNERWYRVAGGDFVHPSIIEIPRPLQMFDRSKDPPTSPSGFRGLKG